MATLVNYDDFIERALGQCVGAPYPMAKKAAEDTLIEFFRRTQLWVEDLDPVYVSADVVEYEIDRPQDGEISAIVSALVDGEVFAGYTYIPPVFLLTTTPTASFDIELRGALVPRRGDYLCPTIARDTYFEELAAGVAARLMMIPRQPWTNPQLAMVNFGMFRGAVDRAKGDVLTSFTNGDLSVQKRRFI